jgi:hypothetical protein
LKQQNSGTTPALGMPGAAGAYRLMIYPDGGRLGADVLVGATHNGIERVVGLLGDPDGARAVLLGDSGRSVTRAGTRIPHGGLR